MTRKWAYRAIRQGWPEFSQWLDAVIQRVEMYNASLPVPLSPPECRAIGKSIAKYTHRNFTPETFAQYVADTHTLTYVFGHCCKVSDEAAFCLIQRPYISKTLLTRRISPRGSP